MAVIDVKPIGDGLDGGADVDSGGRYNRVFQVEFDAINSDILAAINATDGVIAIPSFGAAYPTDSSSVVTGKSGEPHAENPCIWTVRVAYTVPSVNPTAPASPDPPSGGSGGTTSPIPSQKRVWRFWTKTVAITKDINGDLICNSAGDPYDPPFSDEVQYPELVITRTQSTFSPQWMLDFKGKRNHASITIGGVVWLAKQLRIVDILAEYPAGQSGGGWQVTITIRYDPEEHDIIPLDAGYRQLVAGDIRPILDGGHQLAQPALLNGAGAKLPVGDDPVYQGPFQIADTVDFTKLYLDY